MANLPLRSLTSPCVGYQVPRSRRRGACPGAARSTLRCSAPQCHPRDRAVTPPRLHQSFIPGRTAQPQYKRDGFTPRPPRRLQRRCHPRRRRRSGRSGRSQRWDGRGEDEGLLYATAQGERYGSSLQGAVVAFLSPVMPTGASFLDFFPAHG